MVYEIEVVGYLKINPLINFDRLVIGIGFFFLNNGNCDKSVVEDTLTILLTSKNAVIYSWVQ